MLKHLRTIHADDLLPDDILEDGSTVIKVEDSDEDINMVLIHVDDEEDPRAMFNEDFVDIFQKILTHSHITLQKVTAPWS